MRSRYSAYALGLETYLLQTWHPSTRPAALDVQAELTQGKWLGLNIRGHAENGDDAWVEFVARYKPKSGPATRLHECSRFVREQDQWLYLDGEFDHSQKAS
jgi:SEC-C motif domain protein